MAAFQPESKYLGTEELYLMEVGGAHTTGPWSVTPTQVRLLGGMVFMGVLGLCSLRTSAAPSTAMFVQPTTTRVQTVAGNIGAIQRPRSAPLFSEPEGKTPEQIAVQESLAKKMAAWDAEPAAPVKKERPPKPTEPDYDENGKIIKPLELKIVEWEELMISSGYGLGLTKTQGENTGFDLVLNLLFPIILLSSLAFVAFPFLAGNFIDVSTLPMPPTE